MRELRESAWMAVAVLRMWLPNTITNAIDNTSRRLTDHNTPHIASLAQWSIGTPTPTAPHQSAGTTPRNPSNTGR